MTDNQAAASEGTDFYPEIDSRRLENVLNVLAGYLAGSKLKLDLVDAAAAAAAAERAPDPDDATDRARRSQHLKIRHLGQYPLPGFVNLYYEGTEGDGEQQQPILSRDFDNLISGGGTATRTAAATFPGRLQTRGAGAGNKGRLRLVCVSSRRIFSFTESRRILRRGVFGTR